MRLNLMAPGAQLFNTWRFHWLTFLEWTNISQLYFHETNNSSIKTCMKHFSLSNTIRFKFVKKTKINNCALWDKNTLRAVYFTVIKFNFFLVKIKKIKKLSNPKTREILSARNITKVTTYENQYWMLTQSVLPIMMYLGGKQQISFFSSSREKKFFSIQMC